jgi:hypothetical protein
MLDIGCLTPILASACAQYIGPFQILMINRARLKMKNNNVCFTNPNAQSGTIAGIQPIQKVRAGNEFLSNREWPIFR